MGGWRRRRWWNALEVGYESDEFGGKEGMGGVCSR